VSAADVTREVQRGKYCLRWATFRFWTKMCHDRLVSRQTKRLCACVSCPVRRLLRLLSWVYLKEDLTAKRVHHFSWIYILYCPIIRSCISIFYIAVLSKFITVTVCTAQIICAAYFGVQRAQYSTACLWLQNVQFDVCVCVCVRNKIYVISLSARKFLILSFLKICNVILLHFCKCNIFFIE